jgi:hypothetical protein
MAQIIAKPQANQLPQDRINSGLTGSLRGTLANLACKCSAKENVDFLIKEDRIICAFCDREILCMPPIIGIYKATCGCCASPSVKSTFVLDSRGIYICTWCGQAK